MCSAHIYAHNSEILTEAGQKNVSLLFQGDDSLLIALPNLVIDYSLSFVHELIGLISKISKT